MLMEVYTVLSIVKHMVQNEYKQQLSSEPFHIVEDNGLTYYVYRFEIGNSRCIDFHKYLILYTAPLQIKPNNRPR